MQSFYYAVDSFNLKKKSLGLSSIAKSKFKKFIYISLSIKSDIDISEVKRITEILDAYKIEWCKGILADAKYFASSTKIITAVSRVEEIKSMIIFDRDFIKEPIEVNINNEIEKKHAFFSSICQPEKVNTQEVIKRKLKSFSFMFRNVVEFK